MADAAAATPAPAAARLKKVKKTAAKKPSAKPSHPKTADMLLSAVKNLKERGGSSLQAIKKYIAANYKIDADKLSSFIRKYLKSAVASGALIQTKGKGAYGSFKLGKDSEKKAAPKKAAAKDKKRKEKKEKKPTAAGAAKKSAPKKATGAAKKAVAAKKPAGEAKKAKLPKKPKSPSKVKKSKTPAAARKPKSKKATAKPKSPKKAAPKK